MPKILDVGCGNSKETGAIGIDRSSDSQADVIHDLDKIPWPFPDNEFDRIICTDVLEHLNDVGHILEEICRIAKPNAILNIRVPHFSSSNAYADLTHKHFFSFKSFDYFVAKELRYRYLTEVNLKKIKAKFILPKIYKCIEIFADVCPEAYEKYLTYIFPAINMEFKFEVLKQGAEC